jgi:hypothetical protein
MKIMFFNPTHHSNYIPWSRLIDRVVENLQKPWVIAYASTGMTFIGVLIRGLIWGRRQ